MRRLRFPVMFFALIFVAELSEAFEKQPIIDMHLHAQPLKFWGQPDGQPVPLISFPGGFNQSFRSPITDHEVMVGTLKEMDKHNVVFGFLSGAPEHIAPWVKFAPKRFIPSPVIPIQAFNGNYTLPSIAYLKAGFKTGRFKALGEFATQYYGLAPNDPKLEPYFDLAVELDIPVLIHTLGIGAPMPAFRCYNGRPLLLEDVLAKRPKLRLWVENAGWPFLDDIIALMYQYPQVYADLSTISWVIPRETFHDYLEGLIRAGLGKRLMFGSDQMVWPKTIGMAIESIETASFLSDEQKRDIFYNNAARFLRIDQK